MSLFQAPTRTVQYPRVGIERSCHWLGILCGRLGERETSCLPIQPPVPGASNFVEQESGQDPLELVALLGSACPDVWDCDTAPGLPEG